MTRWAGRRSRIKLWVERLSGATALLLTVATFSTVVAACQRQAPPARGPADQLRQWDSVYSVAFPGSGKCYGVGDHGLLLVSRDGGRSWQRRHIAQRGDLSWSDLYSIRFAGDGEHGWISGEGGLVLATGDGGSTWHPQSSGTTESLLHLAVVDAQTAFGAGTNGVLLRTTDGGSHWQLQTLKNQLTMFDIAFSDRRNGWAVGEFQTIIHTTDGGSTWAPQIGGKRASFRLPALFAVRFADAQHGWAAGQGGTLLRTDDGGTTWQTVTSPTAAPMYGISYADGTAYPNAGQLWAVGDDGALMRMALTGGAAKVNHPTVFSLNDIAFNARDGVAVGLSGTILWTADGGNHWQAVAEK